MNVFVTVWVCICTWCAAYGRVDVHVAAAVTNRILQLNLQSLEVQVPSERGTFHLGNLTFLARRYLFLYWRGDSSSQPMCHWVGQGILQGFRRLEFRGLRAFPLETDDGSDHISGFALEWMRLSFKINISLFRLLPSTVTGCDHLP